MSNVIALPAGRRFDRWVKPAVTDVHVDPIFAAIEAHSAAFIRRCEAQSLACKTPDAGPEATLPKNVAIHKAADDAISADYDAGFRLAGTQPSTMPGVLALIDYLEAFNEGKFGINREWRSAAHFWPDASDLLPDHADVEDPDGDLGMAYVILLNVRQALRDMAVR